MKKLIISLLMCSSLYAGQVGLEKALPTTTTTKIYKPNIGYYNPTVNMPSGQTYGTSTFSYFKQSPVTIPSAQRNISNKAAAVKAMKNIDYKPVKVSYQQSGWWGNRLSSAWNYLARSWNHFFNKEVIVVENQAIFNKILTAFGKSGIDIRDEVREILDTHPHFPIDELYSDKNNPNKKMRLIDVLVISASKNARLLPVLKYIITRKGASVNGRIAVDKEEQLTPLGIVLVLLTTRNKQEYPNAYNVFELLLENGVRTNELVIVGNKEFDPIEFAQMIGLSQDIIKELKKERTVTMPTSKSFKKFLDTFDPHTKTYGSITIRKKVKKDAETLSRQDQYAQLNEQRAQEIFNELEKAIMVNDIKQVEDILAYRPGFKINKSYQADTVGHRIRLIDLAAYKAIEDFDKMPDGLAMMKLLIKKGVDIRANFKMEETAFLKLCLQGIKHKKPGAISVLNFFIESGININVLILTRHGKMTPLKYAINNHFPTDAIDMLIASGAKEQ